MAEGDIGSVIASLTFDTQALYSNIIHISGNVYAIAYYGPDEDGWLKTVSISDDGLTLSVIASLEFDIVQGRHTHIVHVSGNVYAIVYNTAGGVRGWGRLKTVSISDDGLTLSVIASIYFDTNQGYSPHILHISGNVYAIAYQGADYDGWLKTVSISDDGLTLSVIASREYDTVAAQFPHIIHVSGNVYAICYQNSSDYDGWLKTISISNDGLTLSLIASLEFDTERAAYPSIIHISGNVYAIAYEDFWALGKVKTISISDDGTAISVITSLAYTTIGSHEQVIIHVSGNVYAIAYGRGAPAVSDGWLDTVSISPDGATLSLIDNLEFDTARSLWSDIIHISGNVYAIASGRTDNFTGQLLTIDIETIPKGMPGLNPAFMEIMAPY